MRCFVQGISTATIRILLRELLQAPELGLSLDIRRVDVDPLAAVELLVETDLSTYDATCLTPDPGHGGPPAHL